MKMSTPRNKLPTGDEADAAWAELPKLRARVVELEEAGHRLVRQVPTSVREPYHAWEEFLNALGAAPSASTQQTSDGDDEQPLSSRPADVTSGEDSPRSSSTAPGSGAVGVGAPSSSFPPGDLPEKWRTTESKIKRLLDVCGADPAIVTQLVDGAVMETIRACEAAHAAGVPWRSIDPDDPPVPRPSDGLLRYVTVGDRLIKPERTVAHNAEGGDLKSRVFVVGEEPKWDTKSGRWTAHNLYLDACHFADTHKAVGWLPGPCTNEAATDDSCNVFLGEGVCSRGRDGCGKTHRAPEPRAPKHGYSLSEGLPMSRTCSGAPPATNYSELRTEWARLVNPETAEAWAKRAHAEGPFAPFGDSGEEVQAAIRDGETYPPLHPRTDNPSPDERRAMMIRQDLREMTPAAREALLRELTRSETARLAPELDAAETMAKAAEALIDAWWDPEKPEHVALDKALCDWRRTSVDRRMSSPTGGEAKP